MDKSVISCSNLVAIIENSSASKLLFSLQSESDWHWTKITYWCPMIQLGLGLIWVLSSWSPWRMMVSTVAKVTFSVCFGKIKIGLLSSVVWFAMIWFRLSSPWLTQAHDIRQWHFVPSSASAVQCWPATCLKHKPPALTSCLYNQLPPADSTIKLTFSVLL